MSSSAILGSTLRLFDDQARGPFDATTVANTTKWFDLLEDFRETITSTNGTDTRVKIAILDSGIDMRHPWIKPCRGRIKDVRTWTGVDKGSKDRSGDNVGHGTHVAGIILTLVTDVDLYIAKVADSDKVDSASHIADVGGMFLEFDSHT
jgi:subtilisin family serine protease